MEAAIKRWLRKPTPLELAVKEVAEIEHSMLSITAEILWAEKRLEYYGERRDFLKNYINGETA